MEDSPFTRQEIKCMKFPTKLWLLVNTPNKVIKWNVDGNGVLIDFVELDNYLTSTISIFKSKSKSAFIRQLDAYGFQKRSHNEENEEVKSEKVLYEYRHENFKQGRTDLISNIQVSPTFRKQPTNLAEVQQKLIKQTNRRYDPCYKVIKRLSNLEKARLNLRIILQMQAENYMLNKKLSECEQRSPSSTVSVIELPTEAFENPFDSISRFEENPDYAGYYGDATTEQIKQFFGEYLPIYGQENGDDIIERSLEDNISQGGQPFDISNTSESMPSVYSSTSQDSANCHSNFQIKYSVSLHSNENKEYTVNILEENCSQALPSLGNFEANKSNPDGINFLPISSSLEPIFTNCDEDTDMNSKEDDFSMDQFLKFKNSPQKGNEGIKDIVEQNETEKMDDGESRNLGIF